MALLILLCQTIVLESQDKETIISKTSKLVEFFRFIKGSIKSVLYFAFESNHFDN